MNDIGGSGSARVDLGDAFNHNMSTLDTVTTTNMREKTVLRIFFIGCNNVDCEALLLLRCGVMPNYTKCLHRFARNLPQIKHRRSDSR